MTRVRVINSDANAVLGVMEMPGSIHFPCEVIVELQQPDEYGVPAAKIRLYDRKTDHSAIVELCILTTEPIEFWHNVRGFTEED